MPYKEDEKALLVAFGARVRLVRMALAWSQEDLAKKVQLDRTYVGAIERGERNLSLININKLARALCESFEEFFPFPESTNVE